MDIFKDTTFTWWQIGFFKVSVLLIGIAIGAYWSDTFLPYTAAFAVVGLAIAIYIGCIWYTNKR